MVSRLLLIGGMFAMKVRKAYPKVLMRLYTGRRGGADTLAGKG